MDYVHGLCGPSLRRAASLSHTYKDITLQWAVTEIHLPPPNCLYSDSESSVTSPPGNLSLS